MWQLPAKMAVGLNRLGLGLKQLGLGLNRLGLGCEYYQLKWPWA
jgi:hypothetical protein